MSFFSLQINLQFKLNSVHGIKSAIFFCNEYRIFAGSYVIILDGSLVKRKMNICRFISKQSSNDIQPFLRKTNLEKQKS